ncbi:MAG: glycosyltransferase family 1 protein [Phototrophicales bacterium]|nr:MAG: glycosyltransferase family 1 protein [Phototrophicales bacterium]
MRVIFNGWFWDQPHTGSGQYLRRLLGALRRIDPDLKLAVVLPAGVNADDVPAGVEVITARSSRSNLGKVWFEQRVFPAAAASWRADIAHVPYWGAPLSSPVRLVTTILDVIPLALPEYASGALARLYVSLVSASARGSAHTITISNAAKADVIQYLGLPAESITTTHLAADEAYHPRIGAERDAEVKAKYDLPDDFTLYLGGFDRRKRVDVALQAYTYVGKAHGEEIPLIIAGREPAWGTPIFPDLRKAAARLNVEPYIRWIGAVDEADKPSLYRLARVFVFPSVCEGFGLPVIEAMACGTPVVASDIPVMREITGDAAYLVKPEDARAMGGALIALLIQEPLREEQIQRGLSVATRYRWTKTARETRAVYERVFSS